MKTLKSARLVKAFVMGALCATLLVGCANDPMGEIAATGHTAGQSAKTAEQAPAKSGKNVIGYVYSRVQKVGHQNYFYSVKFACYTKQQTNWIRDRYNWKQWAWSLESILGRNKNCRYISRTYRAEV